MLKLPETTILVGGDDCVDDDDDDDQDDGDDDNYVDDDGNDTKNLHFNKCWDHPEYALTHHNIQRTATAALQGLRSLHLPV